MSPSEHKTFLSRFRKAYLQSLVVMSELVGEEFPNERPTYNRDWATPTGIVLSGVRKLKRHDWPSLRQHFTKVSGALYSLDYTPISNRSNIEFRCARIALALATGNVSDIRSDEHEAARKTCAALDWPEPVFAASSEPAPVRLERPDDKTLIETAFAWSRGARTGYPGAMVRATTHVCVQAIDPDLAPIVARLPLPDNSHIELRSMDGQWLRPVLAPNSWAPITLSQFASAMRSGEAWRDSPHLNRILPHHGHAQQPPGRHLFPTLPWMDDYAIPGTPVNPDDRRLETSKRETVLKFCTGLISLNNIVWKAIPEPRARVLVKTSPEFTLADTFESSSQRGHASGESDRGGNQVVVTWEAGGLLAYTPKSSICATENLVGLNEGLGGGIPFVVDLPLSRLALAERIAARLSGEPVRNDSSRLEIVDLTLFPNSSEDLIEAAELLVGAMNETQPRTAMQATRRCKDAIEALRAARDEATIQKAAARLGKGLAALIATAFPEDSGVPGHETSEAIATTIAEALVVEIQADAVERKVDDDLDSMASAFEI